MMNMKKTIQANEKVVKYQNLLTGEIVYAPQNIQSKIIDGIEFIKIFNPKNTSFNLMRKDSLKLISAHS